MLTNIQYLVSNTGFGSLNSSNFLNINRILPSLVNTENSNKFLRKVWKTRNIFHNGVGLLGFDKSFYSVHYILKFVKSWDIDVSFFVKGSLPCLFSFSNFNRLRNIFIKDFLEERLWWELEKMFSIGFLNMSLNNVYWGDDIYSFSLLSRFLLELYFFEFDNFLNKLSFDTEYLCKWYNRIRDGSVNYSILLFNSLPIKLESNLKSYNNLNTINVVRSNNFFNYFKFNFPYLYSKSFKRGFHWVRYINFFLLGFVTSKNYSYFLFQKLVAFVRSTMLFDVKNVCFSSSMEKNLFFLGFDIFLANNSYNHRSSDGILKRIDPYKKKVQSRVNFYRIRILKLGAKRFTSELFLHFISLVKKKKITFGSFTEVKLWSYIFQLECVRSLQYGKLVFTNDSVDVLNYSIFSQLKSPFVKKATFYRSYLFNLYIKKLQIITKDTINCFQPYFFDSVLPADNLLFRFLDLLNKKVFFFYENLYKDTSKTVSNLNPVSVFHSNLNLIFSKKVWKVSIPKLFIYKKLRVWGFIHPSKNRPMGNSKFLMLEDVEIINKFAFVSNKILTWFRCCDNFSSVKLCVEIIRQSCFLTLSRKHNKSKSWAYSVYTPNFLFVKKIYFFKLIFPNRRFVSKLTKKFLLTNSIFLFNEKFFLTEFEIN